MLLPYQQNNLLTANTGSLTQTLGSLSATATGTVAINGVLTQTLGSLSVVATAVETITGSLTQTLGGLTLNSSTALGPLDPYLITGSAGGGTRRASDWVGLHLQADLIPINISAAYITVSSCVAAVSADIFVEFVGTFKPTSFAVVSTDASIRASVVKLSEADGWAAIDTTFAPSYLSSSGVIRGSCVVDLWQNARADTSKKVTAVLGSKLISKKSLYLIKPIPFGGSPTEKDI